MSHVRQSSESDPFRVFCICGGFGFPFGTASTKRIRLMGKCLASTGIPFHVWHIGPSAVETNKHKNGEFDGLTFEYLSPSVRRPRTLIVRAFFYLWGCLLLIFRLYRMRLHGVVYVYYQGNLINLWVLWLCHLLKIPAVQEACEWWPGTANGTRFNEWMYRHIMFRWSNGAMPISQEIEDHIRNLAGADYPLCRVPVLVDPAENITQSQEAVVNADNSQPVFLWCGMVDGYKRDVLFLIDAMAELKTSAGQNSLLRIVGPCTEKVRTELSSYARTKNISAACIDIVGFVSDNQLWNYCTHADVLLMPLWDDDRSCTRFPTKLGQYLAAGRPIVTVQIGEMKDFLTEETAMFYPPSDAVALAQALDRLLVDPALGERLASRATQEVLPRVSLGPNASRISKWFCKIYSGFRHA